MPKSRSSLDSLEIKDGSRRISVRKRRARLMRSTEMNSRALAKQCRSDAMQCDDYPKGGLKTHKK